MLQHLRKMFAIFWQYRQLNKKWNGDIKYDKSMFVHRRRNWLQIPVDRVNGIAENPGLFSHVPGFLYTHRNQAAEIDE